MSWLRWLPFRKKTAASSATRPEDAFAARYHRFKLFLGAWGKFQELMTELELTLCCVNPFGMQTVRALCTRITTQVFQCMRQLDELAPGRFAALEERFNAVQSEVAALVYGRTDDMDGPLALPLGDPGLDSADRADPAMTRLAGLRGALGVRVPEGFIATAAACQRMMRHGGLQEEVSRRVQASGGIRPDNIEGLSSSIRSLILDAPVPDDVADALMDSMRSLRQRTGGVPVRVLLRGRVWPLTTDGAIPGTGHDASTGLVSVISGGEGAQADDGGMTLWGPLLSGTDADRESVLAAFRATLALKYSPQATIYRRYRGLRDAGTCVCVGFFVVGDPVAGGVAYTGNPLHVRDDSVHVYAGAGLPESVETGEHDVDAYHVWRTAPRGVRLHSHARPDAPVLDDAQACAVADLALTVEAAAGCRQEVDWLLDAAGRLTLLHARLLPEAAPLPPEERIEDSCPAEALACGGVTVSPGAACGPVHVVRTLEDIRTFPDGGVLVVKRPLAAWGMVLDRACAVVAEYGTPACSLGAVAREFGKPAVFGLRGAVEALSGVDSVTVCGDAGVVYADYVYDIVSAAPPAHNFMPRSPVHRTLAEAAHHILPLTFDPESPDFKARNCQTFHDIARYCHEQAVGEMFRFGSQQAYAPSRVKQLQCDVPKQFWVVDLDDAFPVGLKGPLVLASRIQSVPFRALWRGMNAIPWEGPPPVDAKGFLSVMFEATANPHLDPASQSAFFSEKNYFMVSSNYCSLHSRFGFHFVAVESLVGERTQENYVVFQLRGGAANIERRILRVQFVAELLQNFGFTPVVRRDALTARLEGIDRETAERHLRVAGHLTIHTRQMDMIMTDVAQLAVRREKLLAECARLRDEPVERMEGAVDGRPSDTDGGDI